MTIRPTIDRSHVYPGIAAWRRFWRGVQWSKRQLAALRKQPRPPLVINKIRQ